MKGQGRGEEGEREREKMREEGRQEMRKDRNKGLLTKSNSTVIIIFISFLKSRTCQSMMYLLSIIL